MKLTFCKHLKQALALGGLSTVVLGMTGCATGQPVGLIYTGIHAARAYRAATPQEVVTSKNDPEVSGMACNHGVLALVAWGDGGYAEAVDKALRKEDDSKVLYDVKADTEAMSVLGLVYNKMCTKVTGKVGKVAAR